MKNNNFYGTDPFPGCGIDWSLPKNHFDGVNEFGFVSIWENIGNVDVGDGLVLPLNANFRSDRSTSSSTLGSGWHLALLDANIVQIDERTFMMFDPAGPFRLFWRDAKKPNILSGQSGWKAEIQGDTITAWADCGVKLIFNKGRIASMQLKNRKFDFVYEGDGVSEVREGAMSVLRVEKEAITGDVTGLKLTDNRRIGIERGQRPLVQVINNQNLLGGMVHSLSKISHADGTVRTIEYAVDNILNQTLKLGDRLIVWNPASKKIVKDGEWTYDIKPGAGPFDNAAIERKNTEDQSEFWHYDGVKGKEIVQGIDGAKKVTSWFTSGKLIGKYRAISTVAPNNQHMEERFTYNEAGILLRRTSIQRRGGAVQKQLTYEFTRGRVFVTQNKQPSQEIDINLLFQTKQ